MPQGRIKLDNPVFAGTLRYTRRSVSYQTKPVHSRTVQDIAAVRSAVPKDQPAHGKFAASPSAKAVATRSVSSPAEISHNHGVAYQPQAIAKQSQPIAQVQAGVRQEVRPKPRRSKLKALPLYAAALLIFGFGLYVGVAGLTANKKVTAQAEALAKTGDDAQGISGGSTPPSTEKPSDEVVRRYAVAPNNPRYIDVPSLKIHARVLAMTVDKHNQLQAPYGIYDAGWYASSAQPGQPGAMLVDGHSGVGKVRGIFHDIAKFKPGDSIVITRGDGQKFTYAVAKTDVLDADKVDMASLLVSADTAKPGLNLITCAGDQIPGTFSLKQRVVVYAVLQ